MPPDLRASLLRQYSSKFYISKFYMIAFCKESLGPPTLINFEGPDRYILHLFRFEIVCILVNGNA